MSNVKTAKAPNFSDAQIAELVADYNGGKGMSVAEIAAKTNRSPRSVQGKLVHLGEYVAVVKAPKTFAEAGPSKKVITEAIRATGLLSEDALTGLGNATKTALQELQGVLTNLSANAGEPAPEADVTEQVAA